MAARLTLSVTQGTSRDWQLQIPNPVSGAAPWSGANPSPFLSSDMLAADLWAGQDQPILLPMDAPVWLDPAAATYQLAIQNLQSAGLTPSTYQVQVTVIRSGRTVTVGRLRLVVEPTAGTAAAIPVYGSYRQLLTYAPWVNKILADEDESGFLTERGRARSWLDDILVGRWKGSMATAQLGQPGFSVLATYGAIDPVPSRWLRDQLAANLGFNGTMDGTVLTGSTLLCWPLVQEIVAKRAIYTVCRAQLGGPSKESSYRMLSADFAHDADGLAKTLRAELDFNADGYADLVINCGATNVR